MLRVLDLFSGMGGWALGLPEQNFQTVAFCETEVACQMLLQARFPDIPLYDNVEVLSYGRLAADGLTPIDVITASPPCQPFSIAGKRRGADDDRDLWPEVLRLAHECRPTWVLCETVDGISSMVKSFETVEVEAIPVDQIEDSRDTATVETRRENMYLHSLCQDFEHIGYDVQPISVPACAVGKDHIRQRIWLIAHANRVHANTR